VSTDVAHENQKQKQIMSASKPGLFTPITLGKRTLRNRIVFLPHATGQGAQGLPSEGHLAA
jgi:2,4-dienoyl-CoA reductase-like NADH-dependent reductase (Old Yellow Enzyme family)